MDSFHLAKYILLKGGIMPHKKLQKVLFYVQGCHLAYFEKPLIADPFFAMADGPASMVLNEEIDRVYETYAESVSEIEDEVTKQLTIEQLELIDEVIAEYSALSAKELSLLVTSEQPWNWAPEGKVIPQGLMQRFYKNMLE